MPLPRLATQRNKQGANDNISSSTYEPIFPHNSLFDYTKLKWSSGDRNFINTAYMYVKQLNN